MDLKNHKITLEIANNEAVITHISLLDHLRTGQVHSELLSVEKCYDYGGIDQF